MNNIWYVNDNSITSLGGLQSLLSEVNEVSNEYSLIMNIKDTMFVLIWRKWAAYRMYLKSKMKV